MNFLTEIHFFDVVCACVVCILFLFFTFFDFLLCVCIVCSVCLCVHFTCGTIANNYSEHSTHITLSTYVHSEQGLTLVIKSQHRDVNVRDELKFVAWVENFFSLHAGSTLWVWTLLPAPLPKVLSFLLCNFSIFWKDCSYGVAYFKCDWLHENNNSTQRSIFTNRARTPPDSHPQPYSPAKSNNTQRGANPFGRNSGLVDPLSFAFTDIPTVQLAIGTKPHLMDSEHV